jgi:hypothetical protein
MKAKIMYCMMKCHGNNLLSSEDNNANGIDEMAYVLWDIIASFEGKHICEG